MKQIYCKNCRYWQPLVSLWPLSNSYIDKSCNKVLSIEKFPARITPEKYKKSWEYHNKIGDKYEIYNKFNNCQYYKRKLLFPNSWWSSHSLIFIWLGILIPLLIIFFLLIY